MDNINIDLPIVEDSNTNLLNNPLAYINYFDNQFIDIAHSNNIDLDKLTPSQFDCILGLLYLYIYRVNTPLLFTNKDYEVNKIYLALDTFIYLCDKYNHIISIPSFCKFTGIIPPIIYNWESNNSYSATDAHGRTLSQVKSILTQENERTLENGLHTKGNNPVAYIASLNYRHNWSNANYRERLNIQQALTSDKLPQLSISDEQNKH